eukprot:TRINITY_DN6961_c0_g1_i1.p1 TRINITY_DN6961_c0_g1~~TRINITY_DN6961_c0_g1_i1.p1  ORF type:complete len:475 (-),score=154.22 TRINITY_DN6961_c0_g1_i1:42-1466(-)
MSLLFGDTPLQLVSMDDSGQLSVVEKTAELIRAIDNPQGVGSLVIAGPYHKGKSYLLNRIAKTNNGFKVGLHTEAETKGLWVLARSINGLTVLLIDSEGIDAPGNAATADSRVFALCLLLSSVLVYNTMSLIEEASLRHLAFVTALAEHVGGAGEEQAIQFPQLLWLVRDFQYWRDLERTHDNSANAYMEAVLSREQGGDGENDNIRDGLRKIFPVERRSCYLLPTPALDTEHLSELPESELNPKFLQRLTSLVEDVMPQLITKTAPSGELFATRLSLTVAALNEKLDKLSLFVPHINARLAVDEAKSAYRRGVEFDAKRMPMEEAELEASHVARKKAALNLFAAKAYGPTKDSLLASLEASLDEEAELLRKRNRALRARAYMGFGRLNTAVIAALICLLVVAMAPLAWTMLLFGAIAICFHLDLLLPLTSSFAQVIDIVLELWESHVRAWADDNPGPMVGIIVSVTVALWWMT